MDEDVEQLIESLKERGIITPITFRQKKRMVAANLCRTIIGRKPVSCSVTKL